MRTFCRFVLRVCISTFVSKLFCLARCRFLIFFFLLVFRCYGCWREIKSKLHIGILTFLSFQFCFILSLLLCSRLYLSDFTYKMLHKYMSMLIIILLLLLLLELKSAQVCSIYDFNLYVDTAQYRKHLPCQMLNVNVVCVSRWTLYLR